MSVVCVCCDVRIEPKNRRPFHGIALRLFLSAHKDMYLRDSGLICNTCRMCSRKWRNNTEFVKAWIVLKKNQTK